PAHPAHRSITARRTAKEPHVPHRAALARVDVSVSRCAAESAPGAEHLVLGVRDFVGMDTLATLLRDFILPDFTRKDGGGETSGMLGNGSFKIYQDAERVHLTTRLLSDPARAFVLEAVPIRDATTGRVIDLDLRVADVSKQVADRRPGFFGTQLDICFRARPALDVLMDGMATRYFVKDAMGSAVATLADDTIIPIRLEHPFEAPTPVNGEGKLDARVVSRRAIGDSGRDLLAHRLN